MLGCEVNPRLHWLTARNCKEVTLVAIWETSAVYRGFISCDKMPCRAEAPASIQASAAWFNDMAFTYCPPHGYEALCQCFRTEHSHSCCLLHAVLGHDESVKTYETYGLDSVNRSPLGMCLASTTVTESMPSDTLMSCTSCIHSAAISRPWLVEDSVAKRCGRD